MLYIKALNNFQVSALGKIWMSEEIKVFIREVYKLENSLFFCIYPNFHKVIILSACKNERQAAISPTIVRKMLMAPIVKFSKLVKGLSFTLIHIRATKKHLKFQTKNN